MASILDVAKRAGVSPTTAKRALREPDKLAPETLERVQRAIDELHYVPDRLAAALRSGHSSTIGLIVGSITEPFFATLTRVIGQNVRVRGYTLLVGDSEYQSEVERRQLEHFEGNRVAGLIVRSGYGPSNLDYLARLSERGTAIVEIDHFYPGSPYSHVMLYGEGAVKRGLEHLLSLNHRRIAPIGDHHPDLNPDERSVAFPKVMAAYGLPLPDRYRYAITPIQSEAYRVTKLLMQQDEPPTALFALSGSRAIGAYQALKELNLRVPHDVSLLGFDDYAWTSLVTPGIDVLAQPIEAMGDAATDILFRSLHQRDASAEHRSAERRSAEHRRFSAELIVRGSCAPPKTP